MTALPAGLGDAFHLAAGELGMVSASWLFVQEIAATAGEKAVLELQETLGRPYPVLDAVVTAWLAGSRGPTVEAGPLLELAAGAKSVVVMGLEATFLDVFVPALPPESVVVLVQDSPFEPDWERVRANLTRTVVAADLSTFQRHAGRNSLLLTFGYGLRGHAAYVLPGWLRVIGGDVRTQFRSIVLWNTLKDPPFVYPRWLSEAPLEDFTHVL